jgi:hypothetical protein
VHLTQFPRQGSTAVWYSAHVANHSGALLACKQAHWFHLQSCCCVVLRWWEWMHLWQHWAHSSGTSLRWLNERTITDWMSEPSNLISPLSLRSLVCI